MTHTFLVRFDSPAEAEQLLRSLRQNLSFTTLDLRVDSDIELEAVPQLDDSGFPYWLRDRIDRWLDSRITLPPVQEDAPYIPALALSLAELNPEAPKVINLMEALQRSLDSLNA